jgi:hypothetical protein
MCSHRPPCPSAESDDRAAAHAVIERPEQGWSVLCNGAIVFEDLGQLLPDGRVVYPVPPTGLRVPAAA